MLTRRAVTHQYGQHPANYSPPPFHFYAHEHQYPTPSGRAQLAGPGGGLLGGGAVTLNTRGWAGMRLGNTGYGYLGMDPSAPSTYPRPFVPTKGMISYLNWQAV